MPGTTDIGNHGDDHSNHRRTALLLHLVRPDVSTASICRLTAMRSLRPGHRLYQCLPAAVARPTTTPSSHTGTTGDNLDVDRLRIVRIFTSITGSAPNRIFNIEWRALYFAGTLALPTYELRLYEGQTRFDVIYGTVIRATAAPLRECRRTTPPLTSTSATAQVARLLAGKATFCRPAERQLQRRRRQLRLRRRQQLHQRLHRRRHQQLHRRRHQQLRRLQRLLLHLRPGRLRCRRVVTKCTACKRWTSSGMAPPRLTSTSIVTAC